MARTWGGIKHTLIATTHVSSSWVRAVHLVQVRQTEQAQARKAATRNRGGVSPVQVFDPLFALELLGSLGFLRGARGLPQAMRLLRGLAVAPSPARPPSRRSAKPLPKMRPSKTVPAGPAATYMAVSFIGGPTCVYPFSDERDYDLLRSAASVGKAFHQHYYRKGRGLAFYRISAEVARSKIF